MNWLILIPVGLSFLFLCIFLVKRNITDKKELESKLNNDYRKPGNDEGDIEVEQIMK